MDLNLILKRQKLSLNSTIGRLYVGAEPFCYTLEPPANGHPVCIQEGTYEIWLRYSPDLKAMVPILMNVPGRDFIEIHIGNFPHDTLGCILVGMEYSKDQPDQILSSGVAFGKIVNLILSSMHNGIVSITVKKDKEKLDEKNTNSSVVSVPAVPGKS